MNAPTHPLQPAPGFYHRRLGNLTVTALYDGHIDTPIEDMAGIDPAAATALQDAHFRPKPPRLPMTVFALTDADGTVLIDAGGRPALDPDLGLRAAHMRAAGIDPAKVRAVLLTHLHTDHYGSLIDTDGNASFPNAELVLHANEVPFRSSPPAGQNLSPGQREAVRETQAAVAPYAKRLRTVTEGEVLPGIHAVPLPGHTPGHTGFRVTSGEETLLIWGDIVHFPAVQFAHPEAFMIYDIDPSQSKASRAKILGETAREKYLVAGMHLDFPSFGHVAFAGNAYRWVPEPFAQI